MEIMKTYTLAQLREMGKINWFVCGWGVKIQKNDFYIHTLGEDRFQLKAEPLRPKIFKVGEIMGCMPFNAGCGLTFTHYGHREIIICSSDCLYFKLGNDSSLNGCRVSCFTLKEFENQIKIAKMLGLEIREESYESPYADTAREAEVSCAI